MKEGNYQVAASLLFDQKNLSNQLVHMKTLLGVDQASSTSPSTSIGVSLYVSLYPNIQPWNIRYYFVEDSAIREGSGGVVSAAADSSKDDLLGRKRVYLLYLNELMERNPEPSPRFMLELVMEWCHVRLDAGMDLADIVRKAHLYSFDSGVLETECVKYNDKLSLATLYERQGRQEETVRLLVELGIAEQMFDYMADKTDRDLWESLLCLAINPTLDNHTMFAENKARFLEKMVLQLGPNASLELLSSTEGALDFFGPHQTCQKLLKLAEIAMAQRQVSHEILEKVDSYLWSLKTPYISPQARLLVESELGNDLDRLSYLSNEQRRSSSMRARKLVSTTTSAAAGSSSSSSTAISATTSSGGGSGVPQHASKYGFNFDVNNLSVENIPSFYEDTGGHWGVAVEIEHGVCACCTLPISECVGASILVLRCGHGYHQYCLPEEACVACLPSRFPSLLSLVDNTTD